MGKNFIYKLSSLVIFSLIILVAVVGFYPQSAIPISTSQTYNAIYSGNKSKNNISLMFNVYENTEGVNEIVEILKKHNATATFFVGGCWADDNKETLINILENGNELGNHGYFHLDMKNLSQKGNLEEISCNHDVVKALTGYEMTLFAPPSGAYSSITLKCAEKLGYKTIMWTRDTIDWRDSDTQVIFNRATKNASCGDLILMHPKDATIKCLDRILTHFESLNLNVTTVTNTIT